MTNEAIWAFLLVELEKNTSVHISVFQFKFTNTQLAGRHVMQDIAAQFSGCYKEKTKFFSHLIYLVFEMFEKLWIVIDQVFKIAPVFIIKGEYGGNWGHFCWLILKITLKMPRYIFQFFSSNSLILNNQVDVLCRILKQDFWSVKHQVLLALFLADFEILPKKTWNCD